MFNRLLSCLYSNHKRVAMLAADAAASVLVQVAQGITDASPPPDAKSLFNSFIRLFVCMMDGQQTIEGAVAFSKLDAMRLGMRGCGIFAGAIAAFMGQDQLRVL